MRTVEDRFWDKVLIPAEVLTGCWEWLGSKNDKGYGGFLYLGKVCRAHRVSLVLTGAALLPGLEAHHKCRNRACVNPAHIEQVTHTENVLDSGSPGGLNAKKTHCPRGHPYSGSNVLRFPSDNGRRCKECRNAGVRRG